jgi:hypothetical protein
MTHQKTAKQQAHGADRIFCAVSVLGDRLGISALGGKLRHIRSVGQSGKDAAPYWASIVPKRFPPDEFVAHLLNLSPPGAADESDPSPHSGSSEARTDGGLSHWKTDRSVQTEENGPVCTTPRSTKVAEGS